MSLIQRHAVKPELNDEQMKDEYANWSFYQLRKYISYKAALADVLDDIQGKQVTVKLCKDCYNVFGHPINHKNI